LNIKIYSIIVYSFKLGFVLFCTPPSGRELLMRNFNSQEGVFKPILRIKITPEELSILDSGHKKVQSRVKRAFHLIFGKVKIGQGAAAFLKRAYPN
jgi:hypothetical protein